MECFCVCLVSVLRFNVLAGPGGLLGGSESGMREWNIDVWMRIDGRWHSGWPGRKRENSNGMHSCSD